MPTTQEIPTASPIGRDTPRIDGPLKVSGTARYASDFDFPGLLYAVPVEATIAKGRITKLDTAATANVLSKQLRGIADVFLTHANRDRPEHLEAILAPSIAPAE